MEKKRQRFNVNDDIILLKETLCENPFEDPAKWNFIQQKVNESTKKAFTIRALKEHLQHLMKSFKKTDNINRKKSGSEEEIGEVDILLQGVMDLCMEFNSIKNKRKLVNAGIQARDESVRLLTEGFVFSQSPGCESSVKLGVTNEEQWETSTVASPATTEVTAIENPVGTSQSNYSLLSRNEKKKKSSLLNFVNERQLQERAFKKEELELQYKKLKLEEAALELEKEKLRFEQMKFEADSKVSELRLEMELNERKEKLNADKEQRDILMTMFKYIMEKSNL